MKKLLVLLLVLIPALLLIFVNAVYSAPPAKLGTLPSFPAVTIIPHKSFLPLDMAVDIPDPALHTALHTKTGVPTSQAIHRSDLSALTGDLYLNGLGIADAEGLQYCTNVEQIWLRNNDISDLPDFSKMEELVVLCLTNNDFTAIPDGLFDAPCLQLLWLDDCPINNIDPHIADITSLKGIILSDTGLDSFPVVPLSMDLEQLVLDNVPIGTIPDNINHMTHLKNLSLGNTGLKALPESLFDITGLQILDVSGNDIEFIPSSVSELTNLYNLDLSRNKLESLPDSICSFTGSLNVSFNSLYSLPGHIGDHLMLLAVKGNRLTSLPQSVFSSPAIHSLDISLNRFASLPSGFAERTFEELNLEYNFIDMSPGSPAREIMDPLEDDMTFYRRQLTPVKGLTAVPSSDSVTLSWGACMGGSGGSASWTAEGYVVYLYTGEMVKVSDVDKSQTSYVNTGLTPETAYSYRVGVDYHVTDPGMETDYTNRGYTAVDTTTLAGGAAAETSPIPPSAVITPEPTLIPVAIPTYAEIPPDERGFPVWAIIIAAVGALGIVGTAIAMAVILKMRKPKA
jgi:Leucine-rich repeat (LRR) protein